MGHGVAEEGGQTTHYDGGVAYFAAKATTHLAFAYGEFSGAIGTGLGAFLGYAAVPESGGITAVPATELVTLTLVLGAKGVHSFILLNRTIQQAVHSPMASDGGGGSGDQRPRRKWEITSEGTDKVMVHKTKWGRMSRQKGTKLWWSKDVSGHGGSAWKVFEEKADGLHWYKDADEFGQYIGGKHKWPSGLFIPWKELTPVK